ncbi:hypothetical protein BBIA_0860 [Bifidobacterium biavatii DSM 23969]|uniref:Uncharacterized protein n=2 Tax=Bifidobacterium biavatii TaxID=762212 RepID=A0A087A0Y8_9BIFI|nr:hypothetical protein BBIA_0860 [Bifidobacterium biavatii DSM 23969]
MTVKDIELYRSDDGSVQLEVSVNGDTVWLTLNQMAELFNRDKSTISRHIRNIFAEGELNRDEAVVAKNATTATDGKTYQVDYYNLDVIISVGYRVKSQRGMQFRRWATNVLRQYLMNGYAANERRLEQLGKVVSILARSNDQLAAGIADVVSRYLPGLDMLRDYDAHELAPAPKAKPAWEITIDNGFSHWRNTERLCPCSLMLSQTTSGRMSEALGIIRFQGLLW